MLPTNKRTVTLMELIIAVALLGVIILGAASFDIGSRHLLRASETKTRILNEAALVLDYITKDAVRGIGDATNPALFMAGGFLNIKQDTNGNGVRENNAIDHVISYGLNNTNIIRCDNTNVVANCQVLTQRAMGFVANPVGDNTAHVAVILRFNPAAVQNAFDNPQVRANTDIEVPAQSLH